MKKIITCYLILNLCLLAVAEEAYVDYQCQDITGTCVRSPGLKEYKTSENMSRYEYAALKVQELSIAITKAVLALIWLGFK